jgi:hypothetical protein
MQKRTLTTALVFGLFAPNAWAECASFPPDKTPTSRYELNGGEAYDKNTKLTWKRCSAGQIWQEGSGCEGKAKLITLNDAKKQEKEGWRLPTAQELDTLIASQCRPIMINEDVFPGVNEKASWYWTKKINNSTGAWFVYFESSGNYGGIGYRDGIAAVRLVRGGDAQNSAQTGHDNRGALFANPSHP